MPVALSNTTTANNYPIPGAGGAQITARDIFASGWFTVANAAVFAQYSYGAQGFNESSPDFYLAPGTYPLSGTPKNPVNGIRFKSAVAGQPAQVWGGFFYKDDPVLQSSAEFTSSVSPSGGVTPSGGVMQLISDQRLTTGAANIITFSNIPQTFLNLKIFIHAQSNQAVAFDSIGMRFNNDAGNNYDYAQFDGGGAPAAINNAGNANQSFVLVGAISGAASGTLNELSTNEILIPDYASTGDGYKSAQGTSVATINIGGILQWYVRNAGGLWHQTGNPITRIDLFVLTGASFTGGAGQPASRFMLYGL